MNEADAVRATSLVGTGHKARSALVLFGSETGNAQDVAEETGRLLERLRFDTAVLELDSIQLRDLTKHAIIIFVVSTAGQGELPQNARAFWRSFVSAALKPGVLRRVQFCSFGLGDSSYPRYNVAHRMLYNRLLQLGAKSFAERGEGNEQHPEGYSAGLRDWLVSLREAVIQRFPLEDGLEPLLDDAPIQPHWQLALGSAVESDLAKLSISASLPLQDAYPARIVSNDRVTKATHFQDVRLLEMHLSRNYEYGPGAVAVIHPRNFHEDVQQFIELMGWEAIADTPLQLVSTRSVTASVASPSPLRHLDLSRVSLTIRWLLENALDIMSIPRRSYFALLSQFASTDTEDQAYQKERLLELANPELIDELWDYTTRPKRTILEVMMDFTTVKIPWQYAIHTLPIMRGRQFSIASGGTLTRTASGATKIQLLVAIVEPPSPIIKWRKRHGICTRYISMLQAGQTINIGMQKGYLGVEPVRLQDPVIMIGPGTGVAPMRALIHHRIMLSRQQHSVTPLTGDTLYFGCRSSQDDFYFKDEWLELARSEGLTVKTAFSREVNLPKRYVQDEIKLNASIVATTLVDRHGRVYVSGSSGNMPKAVREAIIDAIQPHQSIGSRSAAESFLDELERSGRYKQETW